MPCGPIGVGSKYSILKDKLDVGVSRKSIVEQFLFISIGEIIIVDTVDGL
jgi:hypothetical protein